MTRRSFAAVAAFGAALLAAASAAALARAVAPAQAPSEAEKIESLIKAVEGLKDAKFVRNDVEYDAPDAAAHMRRKWEAGKEQIKTARDFIRHVASKSSISGKPYLIRFQGREGSRERQVSLGKAGRDREARPCAAQRG